MSGVIGVNFSALMLIKPNEVKKEKIQLFEIIDIAAEKISHLAKAAICAIGSLFQAAKTFLKLPLTAVIAPFAFILEKVGECFDSKTMVKFAEGVSFGFSKDLIMTIHLTHFTFSDKLNEYSLGEVLKLSFEVVTGTEVSYKREPHKLWADYIYGVKPKTASPIETSVLTGSPPDDLGSRLRCEFPTNPKFHRYPTVSPLL